MRAEAERGRQRVTSTCIWPACKRRVYLRNGVWRHQDTHSKYCNASDWDKNVATPKPTPGK